jgi:r1t holin
MWSTAFWKAAAERAIKTAAQALIAVMTADGFDLLDADWKARLLSAGLATLLSLLSSVVSAGAGNPGPSLSTEHVEPEPPKL